MQSGPTFLLMVRSVAQQRVSNHRGPCRYPSFETPHPSRLLPTWMLIKPISGKPEIGAAPQDEAEYFCRALLLHFRLLAGGGLGRRHALVQPVGDHCGDFHIVLLQHDEVAVAADANVG